MNAELDILSLNGLVSCVLLEDGCPAELLVDDGRTSPRRQDILLGLVRQVVPSLSCVFVDIGDSHDALLPIREAPADVKAGQPLMVQVRRETAAGKGHQVTTHIRLPGPFAVYNPTGAPKHRSKLAAFAPDEQKALFTADLQRLAAIWQTLLQDSNHGPVPRRLLALGDPIHTALISCITPELSKIRVEGDVLFRRVYDQIKTLMPPYLPLLTLHVPSAGYSLADVLGLGDLPEALVRRKVWLGGGGYLVIDKAEALTVIDVNSGKDIRGTANSTLRQRINNEAAAEIACQLRLRNIGGGIVMDFLNLDTDEEREALAETLRQALARDRAHWRVFGFTALGLLEMTRTAV
jgi:ribonuclease G